MIDGLSVYLESPFFYLLIFASESNFSLLVAR